MPKWMTVKIPKETEVLDAKYDHILNDIFVVQNVSNQVPVLENGHRNWYYTGKNKDKEWAMISNRHHQLDTMRISYFKTGNPKYANYIDFFLRDFITASWPYPAKQEWGVLWRGLEISFRAKAWAKIFYQFRNTDYIRPATKLLILSSLPDHAHYNKNFHIGGNWLAMEISGLAAVAGYFPEFKKSKEWMEYAKEKITWSSGNQTYPDGVQKELTSHYHKVALENFLEFKAICEDVDIEIPKKLENVIKKMLQYTAKTIRPNGFRILNNDGDLADDRPFIIENAKKYNIPELVYIATNGVEGIQPTTGPSYFYPWAGQLISRNGYKSDSHWSFFDIGPYGSTHQHKDKLHLSIHAYGRDFLVDCGRFSYSGVVADKFRKYALSSYAHNTICIDGNSQAEYEGITKKPLEQKNYKISEAFDYASSTMSTYENIKGNISHTRSLVYVKNKFWIVTDKVISDQERKIDVNWNWHPDCKVLIEGKIARTVHPNGNLAILPITNQDFIIKSLKGEEKPIRAWYSKEYHDYEPNINTMYSYTCKKGDVIAWLLLPYKTKQPRVKTKVLSINDQEVKVRINYDGEEIVVNVPFENSEKVTLTASKR